MSWVLVWDLETVPDVDGFARANGLENLSREEVRAAMGDGFPKLMYHSIICIGALAALRTTDGWAIKAIGASTVGEKSEKELIGSFLKKIDKAQPTLVTFNGNSFDLPVLRYRSMAHSLPALCLHRKKYFHCYSESSIDLCDVLSGYRSENKSRLSDLSKLLGFDGKSEQMNGADVEQAFLDGRIREIGDYCTRDVMNTYRIWLRFQYFRGEISEAELLSSERDVGRVLTRCGFSLPIDSRSEMVTLDLFNSR